jgi:hypothetical protein
MSDVEVVRKRDKRLVDMMYDEVYLYGRRMKYPEFVSLKFQYERMYGRRYRRTGSKMMR